MKNVFFLIFSVLIFTTSCKKEEEIEIVFDDTNFEAEDWTEATHSKSADPK